MALLAQQDPDDASHSYVFWAVLALMVLFVFAIALSRLL